MDQNGYLVLLADENGWKRGGLTSKLPAGATECVFGEKVFKVGNLLFIKLRGLSEKLYQPEPLPVRATLVDVENSDDRSAGACNLTFETPRGKLVFWSVLVRGEIQEGRWSWTLDGKNVEEELGVEGPDFELPPLGEAATLTLKDRVFVRYLEEEVSAWLSDLG